MPLILTRDGEGEVHAFVNASDAPAKAYAVYVPPFDGDDRVLVD